MERRLHGLGNMQRRGVLPILLLAAFATGCKEKQPGMINAAQASVEKAKQAEAATAAAIKGGDDEDNNGSGGGAKKWRDVGIYVDGKPVGILAFGELPV